MPVSSYTPPVLPPPPEPVKPGVHRFRIEDIVVETKKNNFFDPKKDRPEMEMKQELKLTLVLADDPERKLTTWLGDFLNPAKKASKTIRLGYLLQVLTGTPWTEARRKEITGDFLNSLIGQEVQAFVKHETKPDGRTFAAVVDYVPAA